MLLWATKLLHGLVIVDVMSDRRGLLRAEASYYVVYLEERCFTRTSVYVILKHFEEQGLFFAGQLKIDINQNDSCCALAVAVYSDYRHRVGVNPR